MVDERSVWRRVPVAVVEESESVSESDDNGGERGGGRVVVEAIFVILQKYDLS